MKLGDELRGGFNMDCQWSNNMADQDFLLGGCQPIGGVPTSDAYTFW